MNQVIKEILIFLEILVFLQFLRIKVFLIYLNKRTQDRIQSFSSKLHALK